LSKPSPAGVRNLNKIRPFHSPFLSDENLGKLTYIFILLQLLIAPEEQSIESILETLCEV
jgi:hypothetical protein